MFNVQTSKHIHHNKVHHVYTNKTDVARPETSNNHTSMILEVPKPVKIKLANSKKLL